MMNRHFELSSNRRLRACSRRRANTKGVFYRERSLSVNKVLANIRNYVKQGKFEKDVRFEELFNAGGDVAFGTKEKRPMPSWIRIGKRSSADVNKGETEGVSEHFEKDYGVRPDESIRTFHCSLRVIFRKFSQELTWELPQNKSNRRVNDSILIIAEELCMRGLRELVFSVTNRCTARCTDFPWYMRTCP